MRGNESESEEKIKTLKLEIVNYENGPGFVVIFSPTPLT